MPVPKNQLTRISRGGAGLGQVVYRSSGILWPLAPSGVHLVCKIGGKAGGLCVNLDLLHKQIAVLVQTWDSRVVCSSWTACMASHWCCLCGCSRVGCV